MIAALLPAEIAPGVGLALIATSFLTSLITIAFGLGGGALLLAIMTTLMPPTALIPVHGVVQLASNASRVALMPRQVSWGSMGLFTAGSLVGAALGGLVVVNLPPHYVQIGVGLFILWSVFWSAPLWLRRWPAITGGISSFLTMFFGATGLFVATYTRSLGLPRHGFVATHAAMMTVQHGLKTAVFGVLGFAFAPWLALIAAMILAGVAGTLTGRLVLDRTTDARFRRALDILLVLIAARLVWTGVFGD